MKKCFAGLILLICMMITAGASAQWLCSAVFQDGTVCGYINEDGCGWCQWCGEDEPAHGLSAAMAGTNFLRLQWYAGKGVSAEVYYAPAGTGNWTMAGTAAGDESYIARITLSGLQADTAYDVMLLNAEGRELKQTFSTTGTSGASGGSPSPAPAAEYTVSFLLGVVDADSKVLQEYTDTFDLSTLQDGQRVVPMIKIVSKSGSDVKINISYRVDGKEGSFSESTLKSRYTLRSWLGNTAAVTEGSHSIEWFVNGMSVGTQKYTITGGASALTNVSFLTVAAGFSEMKDGKRTCMEGVTVFDQSAMTDTFRISIRIESDRTADITVKAVLDDGQEYTWDTQTITASDTFHFNISRQKKAYDTGDHTLRWYVNDTLVNTFVYTITDSAIPAGLDIYFYLVRRNSSNEKVERYTETADMSALRDGEIFSPTIYVENNSGTAVDVQIAYTLDDVYSYSYDYSLLPDNKTRQAWINLINARSAGTHSVKWYVNGSYAGVFTYTITGSGNPQNMAGKVTSQSGMTTMRDGKRVLTDKTECTAAELSGDSHRVTLRLRNDTSATLSLTVTALVNGKWIEWDADDLKPNSEFINYTITPKRLSTQPGTYTVLWYVNGYYVDTFTYTVAN